MSQTTRTTVPAPTTAQPVTALTGAAAAVYTELCGRQAVTAAALALAAEVSPSSARKALANLEQRGLARRTPGGNDRTRKLADLWYPTTASDSAPADETAPETETVEMGEPCEATAGTRAAAQDIARPQHGIADHADPGQETAAADTTTETPGGAPEEPHSAEPVGQPLPAAGTPAGGLTPADTPNAEGNGQEALVPTPNDDSSEQASPVGQQASAAPAQAPAPDADHVCVCATCGSQLRPRGRKRTPAAVTSGGPRLLPGALYGMVLDHLRADPDQEWTPTGIAKVLARSSGAIGNALTTMVDRGEAIMTSTKPRRYQAAPATDDGSEDGPAST